LQICMFGHVTLLLNLAVSHLVGATAPSETHE
jgi:hypothetical protein